MCQQEPDFLNLDGEAWDLYGSYPIESLLETISPQPRFDDSCSALNRGAIASWSIENDRLYLLDLQSGLQKGKRSALPFVFPDTLPPILAKWFTGTLHLSRGQLVEYGITSHIFEHEASITVKDGVITAKRFIQRDKLLPGQKPVDRTGII